MLAIVYKEAGGRVEFDDRAGNKPFASFVRKVQTGLPEGVKARPGRKDDEDYLWSTAYRKQNEVKAKLAYDPLSVEGLQQHWLSLKRHQKRKEDLIRGLGGEVPSRPTPRQPS